MVTRGILTTCRGSGQLIHKAVPGMPQPYVGEMLPLPAQPPDVCRASVSPLQRQGGCLGGSCHRADPSQLEPPAPRCNRAPRIPISLQRPRHSEGAKKHSIDTLRFVRCSSSKKPRPRAAFAAALELLARPQLCGPGCAQCPPAAARWALLQQRSAPPERAAPPAPLQQRAPSSAARTRSPSRRAPATGHRPEPAPEGHRAQTGGWPKEQRGTLPTAQLRARDSNPTSNPSCFPSLPELWVMEAASGKVGAATPRCFLRVPLTVLEVTCQH